MITLEHIEHMRADFEAVTAILRDSPEDMRDMFVAITENRLSDAVTMAQRLGLTPATLRAQGGNCPWILAGGVFLAIVLYSSTAE